jgi:FdhE protein
LAQRLLAPGEIESLDHTAIPRLLLPQPRDLFAARAARLRQLANNAVKGIPVGATLRGYLLLMAALVDAQAAVTLALPADADALAAAIGLPDDDAIALALSHNMPPLPVSAMRPPAWRDIFDSLLLQMGTLADCQPQFSTVLDELQELTNSELEGCADAVLAQFGEGINPLHAPFVAAALQVVWTLQASLLDARRVQPLVTGALCPVCGSHPVASVIRIGGQSQGYRYLQCGICASEWHMVRVKCSSCEENAHIAYQSLEDAEATAAPPSEAISKANDPSKVARAETCDDCHSYRKIFNQEHDYNVEPLADDLASLMLDVLVGEAGYTRASGNPLLWFSAA